MTGVEQGCKRSTRQCICFADGQILLEGQRKLHAGATVAFGEPGDGRDGEMTAAAMALPKQTGGRMHALGQPIAENLSPAIHRKMQLRQRAKEMISFSGLHRRSRVRVAARRCRWVQYKIDREPLTGKR